MPPRPGPTGDLWLPPGPGVPHGLVISAGELSERFSRSSGPGGQGVNTTDSRVELTLDVRASPSLDDDQRARIVDSLGARLVHGTVTVVASEHRAQRQNRVAARSRLAALLRDALAPPPPTRRATRPTRGSQRRRLETKKQRARTKLGRGQFRGEV